MAITSTRVHVDKILNSQKIWNTDTIPTAPLATTPVAPIGSLLYDTDNDYVYASNGQSWAIAGAGGPPSGPAGGDLSGTYPDPTVAKVNGTSVPASPSVNQAIVATSATSATWQGIVNSAISGTGIDVSSATGDVTFSLTDTAVTPDSYGDASHIPTYTVDAQGRLTAAADVAVAAGGLAFTCNTGTAAGVADNLNVIGSSGITTSGAADTITINNLRDLSAYVVSPISGDSAFTTITAAVTQYNTDRAGGGPYGVIYIKAGTYAENVALTNYGVAFYGLNSGVNISGSLTIPGTATEVSSIINLNVNNGAGNAVTISTTSAVSIYNCSFVASAIALNCTGAVVVTVNQSQLSGTTRDAFTNSTGSLTLNTVTTTGGGINSTVSSTLRSDNSTISTLVFANGAEAPTLNLFSSTITTTTCNNNSYSGTFTAEDCLFTGVTSLQGTTANYRYTACHFSGATFGCTAAGTMSLYNCSADSGVNATSLASVTTLIIDGWICSTFSLTGGTTTTITNLNTSSTLTLTSTTVAVLSDVNCSQFNTSGATITSGQSISVSSATTNTLTSSSNVVISGLTMITGSTLVTSVTSTAVITNIYADTVNIASATVNLSGGFVNTLAVSDAAAVVSVNGVTIRSYLNLTNGTTTVANSYVTSSPTIQVTSPAVLNMYLCTVNVSGGLGWAAGTGTLNHRGNVLVGSDIVNNVSTTNANLTAQNASPTIPLLVPTGTPVLT